MSSLRIIGYELKRIVVSRKYFYLLLFLAAFAYHLSSGTLRHGIYGTAPYLKLSYVHFLTAVSPMLLATLALICASVYSEKEMAVRKILFSAPISTVNYYVVKSTAIAVAFLLIATSMVIYSFVFYGWQYGFFQFGTFVEPILVFLVPSVIFVFGLSMAAGRLGAKLVYGLVPIVLFAGIFCFSLPVWVDLCGNNFLTNYFRMLVINRGSAEIVYYLPTSLLLSRWLLVVVGVLLLLVSCRKLNSV